MRIERKNRETAGSCNACGPAFLQEYNCVLEVQFARSKFRLCRQCADELGKELLKLAPLTP